MLAELTFERSDWCALCRRGTNPHRTAKNDHVLPFISCSSIVHGQEIRSVGWRDCTSWFDSFNQLFTVQFSSKRNLSQEINACEKMHYTRVLIVRGFVTIEAKTSLNSFHAPFADARGVEMNAAPVNATFIKWMLHDD